MIKEKPIIFSTPMVQAILEDRKTQTRRIIKPQPFGLCLDVKFKMHPDAFPLLTNVDPQKFEAKYCPFGKKNDTLYVKETFRDFPEKGDIYYKAGMAQDLEINFKWKPSIYMPKWAARIFLKIKDIFIESLQDITSIEAIKEGIFYDEKLEGYVADQEGRCYHGSDPIISFANYWDMLNKKRGYPWDSNPWVWVIEFERII